MIIKMKHDEFTCMIIHVTVRKRRKKKLLLSVANKARYNRHEDDSVL